MEAAKGKISFEATNGNTMDLTFNIPFEILEDIVCQIIDWKSQCYIKPKFYDEFLEKSKLLNKENK